jgi:predicted phage baseplate assembly protein
MTASDLQCADPAGRRIASRTLGLNAIDYVEPGEDGRSVTVAFLGSPPTNLEERNVRIEAPPGAVQIRVERVRPCREEEEGRADCIHVTFDRTGDLSTYALGLVEADERGRPSRRPLDGFDPRYASAEFSFAALCPSDLDCLPSDDCPPQTYPEPAISYFAKDYSSFRQLILDRLALIMPGWTERHVPDVELMLVELLAYVADYLSYYQDAVATEAYLGTARRRISVRRHARLVDYRMHEGCNARAWVVVSVEGRVTLEPNRYRFLTASPDSGGSRAVLRDDEADALPQGSYEVFEPVSARPITLRQALNRIELWTWGEDECCVAAGATRVTLQDEWVDEERGERALALAPGHVLVFEEVLGPRTGSPNDADPTHRQAVRLTEVTAGYDAVLEQPVVDVAWAVEDALVFPLCLSTVGPDCKPLRGISVARGNVILVDHGRSIDWCTGNPDDVPIPPAPLPDPDCDPCAPPSARRVLEALLGKELTLEEEEVVVEIVGESARAAGFTREVLESFLDLRTSFPVPYIAPLQRSPVTHRVPFPSRETVSAGQARYLESLEGLVRRWVVALLRKAQRGEELSLAELYALSVVFGSEALRKADLVSGTRADDRRSGSDATTEALGHLLDRWPTLLRRKLERLEALAARARSGYVLSADDVTEIEQTWGAQWAVRLALDNPEFDGPACAAMEQDPRDALAALTLTEGDDGPSWDVRPDLLASEATDRGVVVEVDDEGIAHLRFGDGESGRAVDPGTTLRASYRIGNGAMGNVGAEIISRIVLCRDGDAGIIKVRNPLAACGGVDYESLDEVRRAAPLAFRNRRLRAVTASDYAELAGVALGVQRAAASLRWTGSWYEADIALDPLRTDETSPQLARHVAERLYRYRRIGHDLRVTGAEYVSIDLVLLVCVLPNYQRGEVEKAILDALSNRTLPAGRTGFFHPDNLTFGREVALSAIVAVVQAIEGVQNVDVTRFERLGEGDHGERASGVLRLGRFEIARLDNDARRPERGRLTLDMRGGR